MGHLRHQAIVVTSWSNEAIDAAHADAVNVYLRPSERGDTWEQLVSPISRVVVNSGGSFMVAPDGSKEGWSDSDDGDARRAELIGRFKSGDYYVDWVELIVGGDEDPRITNSWTGESWDA